MRRSSIALALGLALLFTIAAVTAALAARPQHDKVRIFDSFTEKVCGIKVTTELEINGNTLIFRDGHLLDLSQVKITWTNADGDWVTNFISGPFSLTETLDGEILTVTAVNIGIHEMLRTSDGLTDAFDRGQITFVDVIDLNDLEDPEDDVLLSSDIVTQRGPHPEADSDFTLFCDIVTDVLG